MSRFFDKIKSGLHKKFVFPLKKKKRLKFARDFDREIIIPSVLFEPRKPKRKRFDLFGMFKPKEFNAPVKGTLSEGDVRYFLDRMKRHYSKKHEGALKFSPEQTSKMVESLNLSKMFEYISSKQRDMLNSLDEDYRNDLLNSISPDVIEGGADRIKQFWKGFELEVELMKKNESEKEMPNKPNNFQQCSHLEVEDVYSKSENPLQDLLDKQKELQDMLVDKRGNQRKFEEMSLRELADFWLINEHAMIDEMHEAIDALGGIKDGIGSASWKNWKKDFDKTKTMTVKDLSEEDMKELKMEVVDMLHFFMNYWISIGGDAKELYNMYFSKHKENIDRQDRGY